MSQRHEQKGPKRVVIYGYAYSHRPGDEVTLCKRCVSETRIPLGEVRHGEHLGICDGCWAVTSAAIARAEGSES